MIDNLYSNAEINTRDPSQDEVRRLFEYDAGTGNLIWRERPREDFATEQTMKMWHTRYAGNIAGYIRKDRYRIIEINGRKYLAHRLAYILNNGPIQTGMFIDHNNGDSLDNQIENLRLASHAENMWNSRKPANNKTGFKGVSYYKPTEKYVARIRVNGKLLHLGYGSLEECAALYEQAANKYHGDFARIA